MLLSIEVKLAEKTSNFENLREMLVTGRFEAGQRLRSDKLAEEFKVSASSIREILFRLSTHGLVDFIEQRGFRMPSDSLRLRQELIHMRILLEAEGVCLSIQNGGVAWEARLTAAHHELSHIETRIKDMADEALLTLWARAEFKFHRTLIEASSSETLMTTHENVYYRLRQQLISSDREFEFVEENVAQHQKILDLVLSRDTENVRLAIRDHLLQSIK